MTDKWDRKVRLREWLQEWSKPFSDLRIPELKSWVISNEGKITGESKAIPGELYKSCTLVRGAICPICEEQREIRHHYDGPADYADGLLDQEQEDHFFRTWAGLCDRCLLEFDELTEKAWGRRASKESRA